MPKLWLSTMEAHRNAVHDGILDATATLVARVGLTGVTMSSIAQTTGIGRATLYKYFPDVDAVLRAWHERQIHGHLLQLQQARDHGDTPSGRLEAVLQAFAQLAHGQHHTELATLLHQGEHVAHAQHQLQALLRELITEGAASGALRSDIAADELAQYCLHALTAASHLPSQEAVQRLVSVTLDGLRQGINAPTDPAQD